MAKKSVKDFKERGFEIVSGRERCYSENDIARIIGTCPGGLPEKPFDYTDGGITHQVDRRRALVAKLEQVAAFYILSRYWAEKPSHSDAAKAFQRIEAACTRLLKTLHIEESGTPDEIPDAILFELRRNAESHGSAIGGFPHHPPTEWELEDGRYMDYHGESVLRDVVTGVVNLRGWAQQAKNRHRQRVNPGTNRNPGDEPLNELFGGLVGGAWLEILEQPIATSVGAVDRDNEGEPGGPLVTFIEACIVPLGLDITRHAIRERVRRLFKDKAGGRHKSRRKVF